MKAFALRREPPPPQIFTLVRASASPYEVDKTIQHSGSFGDAVVRCTNRRRGVALLTSRDEHVTSSFIVTPGQSIDSTVVKGISLTVGAKAVEDHATFPDLAATPYVGWLNVTPSDSVSIATQQGGDQNEVAVLLSHIMRPRSWVAITLRGPTKSELRRTRNWMKHRREGSVTHYSNTPHSLIASFIAGGDDQDEVDSMLGQIVSIIPGFDMDVKPAKVRHGVPLVITTLVSVAAGIAADVKEHSLLIGLVAFGVLAVAGLATRYAPTSNRLWGRRINHALELGQLPPPPRRYIPSRSPRVNTVKETDGTVTQKKHEGTYPLAPGAMLLAPAMTVGIASPHAGTSTSVAKTRMPSAQLLGDIGPLVGDANHIEGDRIVAGTHIDASELYQGVFLHGAPGSGKTVAIQNLWAWHILERTAPSGKPGRPGAQSTLIAFESKGEGARVYRDWSTHFGHGCTLVEVGDPNSPAIDIVDSSLPPFERAQAFVSAMRYAFGEDAIQNASGEALQKVLTAAMTFPPEAFATTDLVNPSFVDVAHALLGGFGDYEDAKAVAAAMTTYYTRVDDRDPNKEALGSALRGLGFLYGPSVTASVWRANTSAPRNKINVLQLVPHWWSPSRPRGPWSQILNGHLAVVINTGITSTGILVDETVSQTLSAMIAFSLKEAIQRYCSNWQYENRSVTIFADELAMLAPSSSEVIEWLREGGRSSGVRLILATQRPAQLKRNLRDSLRSFGTTMIFQQSDSQVISEIISQLTLGGDEWTPADIQNMPQFHAILQTKSGGQSQPPMSIQALYWANDYDKFQRDQGYA
jgi:hypothetical protein